MPQITIQPEPIPLSQAHRRLTIDSEFRLMILLSSPTLDSEIECRLENAIIGSCKPYEALSYVWGEPVFNKQIVLDGEQFMITPNLESALRHLRLPEKERTLWVDSVCINQRDLAERREQVGHMREIYGNCESDVVWLGAENRRYTRGMDIIKRLEGFKLEQIESLGWRSGKLEEDALSIQSQLGNKTSSGGRLDHQMVAPQKRWYLNYSDKRAISGLLMQDTVWKRIWIKQEVACAPKVTLTCGKETLDWDLVEGILRGGRYYTDAFHLPFSHTSYKSWTYLFGSAKVITNQREAVSRGERVTMLDVLARFQEAVSTDPRDKVYGLLGLMSDTLGVKADYTKSVGEAYTEVALALINSSANLDIICQSPWLRPSARTVGHLEGLPEWVPDFSNPLKADFLFAQREIYAPGQATCAVPCVVEEPGTLLLNGFLLGHLNVSKGFASVAPEPSLQALVLDWYQQNLKMNKSDHNTALPYRTGEDQLQAFWRTLAADCKGYPTERLTAEDIAHDHIIIQKAVAQEVGDNGFPRLRSLEILSKLILKGWRFQTSVDGLYVLTHPLTLKGDVVAILNGAKTPMVLRPVGEDPGGNVLYRPIGGAYVHGLMDGEVFGSEDEFKEQVFRLV